MMRGCLLKQRVKSVGRYRLSVQGHFSQLVAKAISIVPSGLIVTFAKEILA